MAVLPVEFHYAARSDVGLVRSNNQDSGYAGPNFLLIADGMGGHAGGDVASAITEARRMAGLDEDAPTWVPTPKRSLLPTTEVGRSVESGLLARLWPFGGERVLAWMDAPIRVH